MKNTIEENAFSLSIGDLMAALLLIFVLLLTSTLLRLEDVISEKKTQNERISEREKVKRSIIAKLKGELDQFDVEIDPNTGVIRIKESVLFNFGSSRLINEGESFLSEFIPIYSSILLSDSSIVEHLSQIIIEGHTDNIGSYQSNLNLSMSRATTVAQFIFSPRFRYFPEKYALQEKLTVNGRSYVEPRMPNNTEFGRQKNRRVEFKFRLKDWDLVDTGDNMLFQGAEFESSK